MVSKGQFVGLDWNRIARLHSRVMTSTCETHLLTIESPVAQWLEHPTRSRRVVGSNPIWDSDFFRVFISPYN